MIAVFVHPRLEVDAVDGPDIGEVLSVQLLPVATVNLRFPELVHLQYMCGKPCGSCAADEFLWQFIKGFCGLASAGSK